MFEIRYIGSINNINSKRYEENLQVIVKNRDSGYGYSGIGLININYIVDVSVLRTMKEVLYQLTMINGNCFVIDQNQYRLVEKRLNGIISVSEENPTGK